MVLAIPNSLSLVKQFSLTAAEPGGYSATKPMIFTIAHCTPTEYASIWQRTPAQIQAPFQLVFGMRVNLDGVHEIESFERNSIS